ncbi:MAG TPA: hypothetical protein VGE07_19615 [Herpetosiphonaceae bacterium]
MHVPPSPSSPGNGRATQVWLTIAQVLIVASLLPWLVMSLFSPMVFDGGFSAEALGLALPVWIYPVFALGGIVRSRTLFARGRYLAAALWSLGPLLYAAVGIWALVTMG